jgi:NOL1/NOP2/sun family putative RNA methylase
MKLPEEFCREMQTVLKGEYSDFIKSYEEPAVSALKINTLKMPWRDFLEKYGELFRLSPIPWSKGGFYYYSETRPGKSALHHAGAFYIQEPAAQAVVACADVQKGEKVLDLCAAPGGKSVGISVELNGSGLLVSNEIIPSRAKILAGNLERIGVKNRLVLNESPKKLESVFPNFFDKIFVDAPCSGEGMFRKDENAITAWSAENVAACAKRQSFILDSAEKMLAAGGVIIYSTCTFSKAENEDVVEKFLNEFPDFYIVRTDIAKCFSNGIQPQESKNNLSDTMRIYPHKVKGEGHFIAVLKKKNKFGSSKTMRASKFNIKNISLWNDFKKEYLINTDFKNLSVFGDTLWSVRGNDLPDLKNININSFGVKLGEFKKNRFEPAHNLAMTLSPEQFKNAELLSLNDKEVENWLSGKEIEAKTAKKGYRLVCVENLPIGFGKCDGAKIKNRYPKGLRIQKI